MGLFENGQMVMQPLFLDKLQGFRWYLDKGFKVNHGNHQLRGWRSSRENIKVNGRAYHSMGVACDITVVGMEVEEVGRQAKLYGFKGVGLYDRFVHVDMRPSLIEGRIFEWDYRSSIYE